MKGEMPTTKSKTAETKIAINMIIGSLKTMRPKKAFRNVSAMERRIKVDRKVAFRYLSLNSDMTTRVRWDGNYISLIFAFLLAERFMSLEKKV